jgi:uncharacterized protein YciI
MNADLQELLSGMLNLKLVVMLREPTGRSMRDQDLREHLDWMIENEKAGIIFASGPFVRNGVPPGADGGLTILRVSGLEHAQEIAETDPFVIRGIISYRLHEWLLMEGGITVKVSFSDRVASIA